MLFMEKQNIFCRFSHRNHALSVGLRKIMFGKNSSIYLKNGIYLFLNAVSRHLSLLLFTPEPRTCCVAAEEHDSSGSLGFAKRIFMPKLQVTGHGVNSNLRFCRSRAKAQMACAVQKGVLYLGRLLNQVRIRGIWMEIQLWRQILNPYELAVRELITKFNHVIREHREKGLYSPIEHVCGRVKAVPSILDKLQKKKITLDRMEDEIDDIAGIRITCQFVEDIEKVVELVRKRSDMEVVSEKDYIHNTKPSGYRSYHMIVDYQVETLQGPKSLRAEIQIRTLAMDFWATIEHSLQYKYKANIPEHIRERLSNAADAILALDKEMSSVRSEIMDAQNSSLSQLKLVEDILNNIENLYRISNKREVNKIQDEFYRIYQMHDITKLKQFHRQLDIISEGYRAQAVTVDLEEQ